jgi:hypothetical protein
MLLAAETDKNTMLLKKHQNQIAHFPKQSFFFYVKFISVNCVPHPPPFRAINGAGTQFASQMPKVLKCICSIVKTEDGTNIHTANIDKKVRTFLQTLKLTICACREFTNEKVEMKECPRENLYVNPQQVS